MVGMLKWWFILVCSASAILVSVLTGYLGKLWVIDHFKISFVTLTVYTIVSLFVGRLTYQTSVNGDTSQYHRFKNSCLYAVDLMTQLGLIGTVIGFIIMLGSSFSHLNGGDVTATQAAMMNITTGASIALVNTLSGLVCSVLLNLQVLNLNMEAES